MLAEGFLMRFQARLPLRARGCAIASTEQRPPRDFRARRNSGLSSEKSPSRRGRTEGSISRGVEGAKVETEEDGVLSAVEKRSLRNWALASRRRSHPPTEEKKTSSDRTTDGGNHTRIFQSHNLVCTSLYIKKKRKA